MDLDTISLDAAFTFLKFRALCVQKGICQCCGQQFDEAHKKFRGCVVSDSKHMDIKKKIELFCKWSSTHSQSISQVDTACPTSTSKLFSQLTRERTLCPQTLVTQKTRSKILPGFLPLEWSWTKTHHLLWPINALNRPLTTWTLNLTLSVRLFHLFSPFPSSPHDPS
jgi:hypothetical protein